MLFTGLRGGPCAATRLDTPAPQLQRAPNRDRLARPQPRRAFDTLTTSHSCMAAFVHLRPPAFGAGSSGRSSDMCSLRAAQERLPPHAAFVPLPQLVIERLQASLAGSRRRAVIGALWTLVIGCTARRIGSKAAMSRGSRPTGAASRSAGAGRSARGGAASDGHLFYTGAAAAAAVTGPHAVPDRAPPAAALSVSREHVYAGDSRAVQVCTTAQLAHYALAPPGSPYTGTSAPLSADAD